MNFLNFLKYNNVVPIAVSVVLLGAGATFAAVNPDVLYSTSEEVISIDNTYLVQKDLATFSPRIEISSVTEDAENYYTAYTLSTIDLDDSVWQDIQRDETMQVSKADLGPYRDLGVYVTEKMKDIVDRELQRLRDTQMNARAHVSQKVVATAYGGLIGKFLDATTEQLPGYTPVVQPAPGEVILEYIPSNLPGGPSESSPPPQALQQGSENTPNTPIAPSAPVVQHSAPVLKVLGNNPAEIPLGSTYNDLGAVIVSMPNNYGVHVSLDGNEVQQISLDTSVEGDHVVTYTATNQEGDVGTATRTVRIFNPFAQNIETTSDTSTTAPDSVPAEPNPDTVVPDSIPAEPNPDTAAPDSGTVAPAETSTATSTE